MTKTNANAFRVWDSEESRYLEETYFDYITINTAGDLIWWGPVDDNFDFRYMDLHRYKIERFTGLTDKNSKDIYEGDIVKCGDSLSTVIPPHHNQNDLIHVLSHEYNRVINMDAVNGRREVVGTVHD